MPDEADDNIQAHAAGPWQEGEPEKRGRYLVEYEEYDQRRVFVANYRLRRIGDDMELQWAGIMDTATVLRYAPIHSPYIQYHE
jgi:hypothetical protein